MISLTEHEATAFLSKNGFSQSSNEIGRYFSPNSEFSVFIDWRGEIDKAMCRPPTPSSNCIWICKGETCVPTGERFDLSEAGMFEAVCKLQELETKEEKTAERTRC
jgi:hypothetical protein